MSYFWCEYHKKAHADNEITDNNCLLVGPYSDREQADDFGFGGHNTESPNCWCRPIVSTEITTGNKVIIHRDSES